MHRLTLTAATIGFIGTVYLANWLVDHYGPIRVWPTELYAPAGVYAVSLALVLRDFIQYRGSRRLAYLAIFAGTALSLLVSTTLAEASALAFLSSELLALVAFWLLQRRSVVLAVLVAGIIGAAVDSYVFLTIAFHSLEFFRGQFVAKVTLSLLAIPIVMGVRLVLPRPEPAAS
jgi:queuosine precursor transporter